MTASAAVQLSISGHRKVQSIEHVYLDCCSPILKRFKSNSWESSAARRNLVWKNGYGFIQCDFPRFVCNSRQNMARPFNLINDDSSVVVVLYGEFGISRKWSFDSNENHGVDKRDAWQFNEWSFILNCYLIWEKMNRRWTNINNVSHNALEKTCSSCRVSLSFSL